MSKRVYKIAVVESDNIYLYSFPIEDIMSAKTSEESELSYSLYEIVDEILDLKIGESRYLQPNRDDKDSKGIILRTA